MSSLSVFIAWLVECFIHRDGDTLRIHQRASPWWNNDDLEIFNTYTRRCIYSLSPIKKRSLRLIPWISACKAIFLPLQLLPYVCLLQLQWIYVLKTISILLLLLQRLLQLEKVLFNPAEFGQHQCQPVISVLSTIGPIQPFWTIKRLFSNCSSVETKFTAKNVETHIYSINAVAHTSTISN